MQRLQKFSDFEKEQRALTDKLKKIDMECISCTVCQSQFFEEVSVMKFKSSHNIILGQNVPAKPGTISYKILRCIHCQNILEPRILHHVRDIAGGDYDELLDTLEGKRDKRNMIEERGPDAIPSQKL